MKGEGLRTGSKPISTRLDTAALHSGSGVGPRNIE